MKIENTASMLNWRSHLSTAICCEVFPCGAVFFCLFLLFLCSCCLVCFCVLSVLKTGEPQVVIFVSTCSDRHCS